MMNPQDAQIEACKDLFAAAEVYAYARSQAELDWLAPIQYCQNTETGQLIISCKDAAASQKLLEFIKTL